MKVVLLHLAQRNFRDNYQLEGNRLLDTFAHAFLNSFDYVMEGICLSSSVLLTSKMTVRDLMKKH